MKIMFLDESGDHSLAVIDSQYPMFVLGGVIVDLGYATGSMAEQVNRFKMDLFGRGDLILHTADIVRNRNGFEKLRDAGFRQEFYEGLNELMGTLSYQVVACAIRKEEHLTRYGMAAVDPYMLSLDILAERFFYELGAGPKGGMIVAEKRDPTLDRQLRLAWENLKVQGTDYVRGSHLQRRIRGLHLRNKKDNIAGLQIADLVVSPIGRFVLGKRTHEDFRTIEAKFRRDLQGEYYGRGLVILPKK